MASLPGNSSGIYHDTLNSPLSINGPLYHKEQLADLEFAGAHNNSVLDTRPAKNTPITHKKRFWFSIVIIVLIVAAGAVGGGVGGALAQKKQATPIITSR